MSDDVQKGYVTNTPTPNRGGGGTNSSGNGNSNGGGNGGGRIHFGPLSLSTNELGKLLTNLSIGVFMCVIFGWSQYQWFEQAGADRDMARNELDRLHEAQTRQWQLLSDMNATLRDNNALVQELLSNLDRYNANHDVWQYLLRGMAPSKTDTEGDKEGNPLPIGRPPRQGNE